MSTDITIRTRPGELAEIVIEFESRGGEEFVVGFTRQQTEELVFALAAELDAIDDTEEVEIA